MSEPRCFPNTVKPISPDTKSLNAALITLKRAILSSVELLLQQAASGKPRTSSHDSLYTGNTGIALMFLRLTMQFDAADLGDHIRKQDRNRISKAILSLLPPSRTYQVSPGRLSPLDSPVGPALVYMLANLGKSPSSGASSEDDNWKASLTTVENAISCAVEDQSLGGDEVLYGRAGLLWAMLNLRLWVSTGVPSQRERDISRIVNTRSIEQVIKQIVEAGQLGARWYARNYGEQLMPLMWPWHDRFYLGAMHGAAGILTVLLQAPPDIIGPRMPLIIACTSALCEIARQHDGHLPSSLPSKHRPYEYVQICHGSPGLLLLLAVFRSRFPDEWREDWEATEALAAEKVWKEGLVRKGIGICHGVSGNAWSLLLHSLSYWGSGETNTHLSRGLSFLIQAAELPPLVPRETSPFRTPDHPLSLFEGLAGAVCAWLDACIMIREASEGLDTSSQKMILGFPGLGGAGVHGYL